MPRSFFWFSVSSTLASWSGVRTELACWLGVFVVGAVVVVVGVVVWAVVGVAEGTLEAAVVESGLGILK